MKFLFRLVLLALLVGGLFALWQKHNSPAPAPAQDPSQAIMPSELPRPDLSVRTWTDPAGRTFEGALVSAKDGQVIIRRSSDSLYFQLPVGKLSSPDQEFVAKQVTITKSGGLPFPETVDGLHTLARKLSITGYMIRVPDSEKVGGWRNDTVGPMYWLLLSPKLHGADAGSLWVRVDEKTFRAHEEATLITGAQLANFSDGRGGFSETLQWSRPLVTIVEAQYGPNAKGLNVTHKLMKLAANGRLPVEIQPEIFDLLPHAPAAWELTVAWRTPTGEVRRTLTDGSVLTWP